MIEPRYPLQGVTVVDLGQIYNGPYATFLMAMAGARVIKIEPRDGESLRHRTLIGGAALPFAMLNSNKLAATLNLKSTRGRELLIEMARRADVLLENFVPGTMERLGIGYEVLRQANPRLIYASGSGFGRTGPYRDYPAMDITIQAMSGVMSVTGFPDGPPTKAGPALCDFFCGTHLYGAVVTALYEREQTGHGRLVEVAMLDAVYFSLSSSLGLYFGSGSYGGPIKFPQRTGNRHSGLAAAPYGVYRTADGYVTILCANNTHWKSLLKAMDREDLHQDARFGTPKKRAAHGEQVDEIVGAFAIRFGRDDLFKLLLKHRVPCAPVRDLAEVTNDPHLHARGMLQWIEHPQYGRIALAHSPLRFDGVPLMQIVPSAKLGEQNAQVYSGWLGLSQAEFERLQKEEVI
ncbi:MAG: formyl-CoA transferase [Betaproteobacteria bacterium RIFCSPLOWO2_12_FULL_62_13]|nr:MAG: formyl-CoA transferase [Betaproteobacteria bacterium RIFCSPLOWO2_12_FULL_62_13]